MLTWNLRRSCSVMRRATSRGREWTLDVRPPKCDGRYGSRNKREGGNGDLGVEGDFGGVDDIVLKMRKCSHQLPTTVLPARQQRFGFLFPSNFGNFRRRKQGYLPRVRYHVILKHRNVIPKYITPDSDTFWVPVEHLCCYSRYDVHLKLHIRSWMDISHRVKYSKCVHRILEC